MEEAMTQIRQAVVNARIDILSALLQQCRKLGHNPRKILRDNVLPEGTFLHLGTSLGHQDIVRTLLNAGSDPSVENRQGENAYDMCQTDAVQQVYIAELLRATAKSDVERMDEFLKAGVDVNSCDCEEKRNSVLHWAVSFANTETITFLIERGANVNSLTCESVTPLHDAVDRGDISIIEALLKANASPLIKAGQGKFENASPLDLATRKPEIFSSLSQFLASQFRSPQLMERSSSIDSVSSVISPDLPSREYNGLETNHHSSYSSNDIFKSTLHSGFDTSLERVIRGMELQAPIQPLVIDPRLSNLWPQPKTLICLEGVYFRPEKILHVSVIRSATTSVHSILDVFSSYKEHFQCLGFITTCSEVQGNLSSKTNFHSSQVQCGVNAEVFSVPNSYKLQISSEKVRVLASDVSGLRYGIATFIQLLTLYANPDEPTAIPPMEIRDHPSLKHRAVFLDVSSERIPSLDNLSYLIQSLSLFKMNYFHLHLRVTTSGQFSYTKGELVAIDRICSDVGIVLVPAVDISSEQTIPEYFQCIKPLLNDILPCFASTSYIHIGPYLTGLIFAPEFDHTERTAGFNAIWEFLPVSAMHSTILLCYNALVNAFQNRTASQVPLLNVPSNVILIEYGFQADYNFAPALKTLAQNGCSTMVMGGTSAWSSFAGCPEATLCNLFHGSTNAVKNSSLGLIVANWSGSCNFTPRVFGWPGFLLAAGLSWNHRTHFEYLQGSLSHLLSTYVLKDPSGISGQAVLQLGCAEFSFFRSEIAQSSSDMTNLPPSQGTTLYRFLTNPDSVSLDNLSFDTFNKCIKAIKKCHSALMLDSKMKKEDSPVFSELCLTIDLMMISVTIGRRLLTAGKNPRSNMGLAAVNLGVSNLPAAVRSDVANKLLTIIDDYQRIWVLTNYPEGLETSLHSVTATLQRFIPDSSRLLTRRLSTTSGAVTNGVSPYPHKNI